MLQAIAIDDEPIALEIIKNLAAEVPFIEVMACFTNALAATSYLQKNKVDVLFLDIKMPNLSGIDFIKTISNPPLVIFTTAYSEHAVQSFELDAIDYLLKPFSLERFLKACNKAFEQFELRKNHQMVQPMAPAMFIKSGYEHIRVELDDILYVESVGNYVQFVKEKQNITSRLTMGEADAFLPGSAFVRIHRSYIVSKKHIRKIDKRTVWINQKEIPIGEAYLQNIKKIIKNN
ncbi:LytTR family DNA-binding domain-containing protein [Mucilaginibacter sp.]|uniref:LytR/AlgR family response regulator transcription factor n=1 Tax=Mucilaginibacter sp. TaxID=1882438 RepID=UPI002636B281|nr:LytTR family DNA-binding domain-containing protein [Mucilaginibacter sp.]MDB5032697.1 DNA-binding response regulator [Mucilaginibacter sp.]